VNPASGAAPHGLTQQAAAARLASEGRNELPRLQRRSVPRILREVLGEPMFQLLLAACLVYLLLGDRAEALLLLGFACGSIVITILQEIRTENALEALRELASPRALVIREGQPQRVAGSDVVRDDIVMLAEGDRVPADLRLLSDRELRVDESLLTGESVAVSKRPQPVEGPAPAEIRPGGDGQSTLYAGTLIVGGEGLGRVYATGLRSELGKIGRLLSEVQEEPSPLHRQTRRIVRVSAAAGLSVSLVVALVYGLVHQAWLQGALAGLALAMALLPEEFPLVLTVFLALGAHRMAQQRVLTRRASAIETLGAATVLCTDKTGTLTMNRMEVAELRSQTHSWRRGTGAPSAGELELLTAAAIAASKPVPIDPMDRALRSLGAELGTDRGRTAGRLAHEYGLTPELPVMTLAWRSPGDETLMIAAKGAPEAIARLCRLSPQQTDALRSEVDRMATQGMRVLGVAHALHRGALPASQQDFGFHYLGLVGFSDPLRPSVVTAIQDCRKAGVRVIMITGDYPATARAIAHQAGLDAQAELLTGADLERLDEAALRERVRQVSVFARVVPQQKLRIVEALKANGEIVAMTGDGVNDAPSLRAAHIGVAMGGRGTDVAREAAALVLLDDDFGSLAAALRQGRRIFDNLRKAMCYILAVHVPVAGLALLPLLFGWPMVLAPAHIVFLEMVIDPVCAIVFEAESEEDDIMRRPPRDPRQPLLSRALVLWSLAQGAAVLLLLASMYALLMHWHTDVEVARALLFVALVATNFGLILLNRSFSSSLLTALRRPNPALWRVLGLTATALAVVLYLPAARELFQFATPPLRSLLPALVCGLAALVLLERTKALLVPRLAAAEPQAALPGQASGTRPY